MRMTIIIILICCFFLALAKFSKSVYDAIIKHEEAINEEREAFNSLILFLGTKFDDMEIEDFDSTKKK